MGGVYEKRVFFKHGLLSIRNIYFLRYSLSTVSLKFSIPATGISRRPKLVSLFTTSNWPKNGRRSYNWFLFFTSLLWKTSWSLRKMCFPLEGSTFFAVLSKFLLHRWSDRSRIDTKKASGQKKGFFSQKRPNSFWLWDAEIVFKTAWDRNILNVGKPRKLILAAIIPCMYAILCFKKIISGVQFSLGNCGECLCLHTRIEARRHKIDWLDSRQLLKSF